MTVCPFAAWRPVANHGGRMAAHAGLVLHVQQGNGGLSGWFNNPTSQASSTWWVSKAGALEQYVDADLSAWAQGAGNLTYNSVETEGYTTEPLTAAAEATLARLYAWGHDTYAWPFSLSETPGQAGFGWHGMGGMAWGGHVGCPGSLRRDRRPEILAAALSPTPGDDDLPLNDADKKWLTEMTAKQVNDALRQQFRPEGEVYGRVFDADSKAIRQTPANIPK